MKKMVKIIRKVDIEKQYYDLLMLEQDYELSSLHDAIQRGDKTEMEKSIKRLKEIRGEVDGMNTYA